MLARTPTADQDNFAKADAAVAADPATSLEDQAWAAAGVKALENARNNPAPSCGWSLQHMSSRYGNFCFLCGKEMDPPNPTWRRTKATGVK